MAPTNADNSSRAVPAWFLGLAMLLLGVRLYAKLAEDRPNPDRQIKWLTVDNFEKSKSRLGPDLVFYEFGADWCEPCKKRERTTFREKAVVERLNRDFVPVRVDLTSDDATSNALVKKVVDKFNVKSIPRCVITLKSGDFVRDDRYMYSRDFGEFLDESKKRAAIVHAELDCASGAYKKALGELAEEYTKGKALASYDEVSIYLLAHHLLLVTGHEADAAALVSRTEAETKKMYEHLPSTKMPEELEAINSYLAGKLSEADLLVENGDRDRGPAYLAAGLKHLREGDKNGALSALYQASVANAKNYNSDKLADYMVEALGRNK